MTHPTVECYEEALETADKMIQHTNENDPTTRVADALADLMHWADANDADFGWALDRAEGYYEEEKEAVEEHSHE